MNKPTRTFPLLVATIGAAFILAGLAVTFSAPDFVTAAVIQTKQTASYFCVLAGVILFSCGLLSAIED